MKGAYIAWDPTSYGTSSSTWFQKKGINTQNGSKRQYHVKPPVYANDRPTMYVQPTNNYNKYNHNC